ncbi:hybrid sensor histidine kinase/response regulator transcription factor [Flavivirga algicola]|uniref:histidine kinase n=1 Tax=Flavivirga algicola TaxID=2729136 RepID=A0ABX1RWP3_9FLAO|nr:ATP-binding protein [Flavivirga algicola]NMH86842.1 response regulator [Flavivirga algicola]
MFEKKYKLSILLLSLFFFVFNLFAQKKILEASSNFTISSGLSHNGITSILEDSNGYLWFGTYEGLSLYDGYDFKIYKNRVGEKSLVSNRVRTLFEDQKGKIWIGTDEGISLYDLSTQKFKSLYSNKLVKKGLNGPVVRSIISNKDGFVVCATEESGVLVFDDNYNFINAYTPKGVVSQDKVRFFQGIMLDESQYLYATSQGLFIFNLKTKSYNRVLQNNIMQSSSISVLDQNTLLVTLFLGVAIIEIKKEEGGSITFQLRKKLLTQHKFNSSMVDSTNKLWLGLLNDGAVRFNQVNDFIDGENGKELYFEFNSGYIKSSCFYETTTGDCWLGTFNEGLFKFELNQNPFKKYNTKMGYKYGVKANNITEISPIDDKSVYLSDSGGGVAIFNTELQKFEPIKNPVIDEKKIELGNTFYDSRQNLWFKVNGAGLCRLKKNDTNIEVVYNAAPPLFNYIHIQDCTEDKDGNIWVVGNYGVFKIIVNNQNKIINVETINDNPYFKSEKLGFIRCVYPDPLYDYVWIGTDKDGLFRISNKAPLYNTEIDQYVNEEGNDETLSDNFVSSIIRLPNEELYVGTEGGGICKVLNSDSKPKFVTFSEKEGLSNNVVKSILYDNEYNLWIATNIGLNKFNTKDYTFRRFTDSDGLPFEDFWYASEHLKNGYLMFSGLDGFCYFKPEDILNKEALPRFELENLKLFNRSVTVGDSVSGRVILDKRLAEIDEVKLKHNENVFSLELTSLHFSNPKNHHIRYKLSPLNEEWVEVPSNQKTIYFSGLPPGEYILNTSASNSLNEWTPIQALKITVSTPYWKTKLAFFIYFLIVTLIVFLIIKVIFRIQALNHKVEIEQMEIDNVKHLNAAKLRFFSNISHEIKTPLTLISGPINLLIQEFGRNFNAVEKLKLIQRQSKKMIQLVDQVHDFQKADFELLKMNYSHFHFNLFIEELIKDFEFLAKNEDKQLSLKNNASDVYVSADKQKLEKIFNNLLNNAFKYTKKGDSISLHISKEDKNLIVSVIDTGRGIDSKDLEHVFERFYQSHKRHESYIGGSGIGLAFSKRLVEMHYGYISAESEINEGTTFTVRLPIVKKGKNNNETSQKEILLTAEKELETNTMLINNDGITDIKIDTEFSDATIFYAEDNLDMRLFVSKSLSKFFNITTFVNGQECLDAMENEWPDIIISDLLMPELNGLDLCKRVKSDVKTSHIPVILLTACVAGEDRIQGLRDGADAYIKKPFNMEHLVTRVEALLLNRKQLRERYQIGIPLTKENNKNNANDNAFLEKLYNLMAENLDNQDLDINQFARKLFLNRTLFYQKVKALTNHTPFELLKMYRLTKGAEFLVQEKLSVKEVAIRTGFKSRTHFTRLFKEKYGTTPGMYATENEKKYS